MPSKHAIAWIVFCFLIFAGLPGSTEMGKPLVRVKGSEFDGEAIFGMAFFGMPNINYVYSQETGEYSTVRHTFFLSSIPAEALYFHLRGRDDVEQSKCPIDITLNEKTIFQGKNEFSGTSWEWRKYPIAPDTLREGTNELTLRNIAETGRLAGPPWFMVAEYAISGTDFNPLDLHVPIDREFHIQLADRERPLPEPLSPNRPEPGFRIRGIKGWNWSARQYLDEIPLMAEYRMNFLMNCYLSFCEGEYINYRMDNRWWEPIPEAKKAAFEEVVRSCQEHGIQFCFSMNPNFLAARSLQYESEKDFDDLWKHYQWMQGLGVRWFNISLDDISHGIDPVGQSKTVNKMLERLRKSDPDVEFIFTPTVYRGMGDDEDQRKYLIQLAAHLDPQVYVFWTGPKSVTRTITKEQAETYKNLVKHRLIIWDNYPVNDSYESIHLGPVSGRDPRLCEVADGYMGNPLHPQSKINRIPLLTQADYAYNPWDYDPARSIGQAILRVGKTPRQQETLKDLVELYPGMILFDKTAAFNPVLYRFNAIIAIPHSRFVATEYIDRFQDVADRFSREFSGDFDATRQLLDLDLTTLKNSYLQKYGEAYKPE